MKELNVETGQTLYNIDAVLNKLRRTFMKQGVSACSAIVQEQMKQTKETVLYWEGNYTDIFKITLLPPYKKELKKLRNELREHELNLSYIHSLLKFLFIYHPELLPEFIPESFHKCLVLENPEEYIVEENKKQAIEEIQEKFPKELTLLKKYIIKYQLLF